MTVTNLVMPLCLPIIAPRDAAIDDKLEKGMFAPTRIRLPPRSRTGCWYVSFHPIGFLHRLTYLLGHAG